MSRKSSSWSGTLKCKESLVRFPAEAYIFILNFSLPIAHSSAKPIQMKSSMTFIQSNGYKEIYLILNNYGDGLYDD